MQQRIFVIATLLAGLAFTYFTWQTEDASQSGTPIRQSKHVASKVTKPQPEHHSLANSKTAIQTRPKTGNNVRRCPRGQERHPLLLIRGEKTLWKKAAKEVMQLHGTVNITIGRHKDEPGLPLTALIHEHQQGGMVEVVPCRGDPLRFMMDELSLYSGRYMVVLTPKGILKLMDYSNPRSGGRVIAKNLHSVRVYDLGFSPPGINPAQ